MSFNGYKGWPIKIYQIWGAMEKYKSNLSIWTFRYFVYLGSTHFWVHSMSLEDVCRHLCISVTQQWLCKETRFPSTSQTFYEAMQTDPVFGSNFIVYILRSKKNKIPNLSSEVTIISSLFIHKCIHIHIHI